jgi:hypothetical protein
VLIADDVPVDEARRDALIETFQVTQRPATDDYEDGPDDDAEPEPDPDVE